MTNLRNKNRVEPRGLMFVLLISGGALGAIKAERIHRDKVVMDSLRNRPVAAAVFFENQTPETIATDGLDTLIGPISVSPILNCWGGPPSISNVSAEGAISSIELGRDQIVIQQRASSAKMTFDLNRFNQQMRQSAMMAPHPPLLPGVSQDITLNSALNGASIIASQPGEPRAKMLVQSNRGGFTFWLLISKPPETPVDLIWGPLKF